MTKFLHSADWQLGMTRHFLSPEAQARFTAARLESIRTIGSLAVAEGCGFVVVCGDVFETNQVARQIVVRALDAMAATPAVRFYLLPGNHDPLDASSVFRSATFLQHLPDNVVVLDQPGPRPVGDGVVLVAAPWFSKRPLGDLVHHATRGLPDDGTVRIVVGHGAVDILSPDAANPALVALEGLETDIDAGRIHYVALGDRHSTTDVGRSGRVFYAGAPEPTDYDEVDPGNVLVVEVTAHTTTVMRRPIGTWQFLLEHFDLAGAADCDRLESWLAAIADKGRTIVKLALVGQLSLAEAARLAAVVEHHQDLLAALETWERRSDLVVLPDDGDLAEMSLSGFAREALDDLRRLAAGDPAARDALGLLYRLGSGPAGEAGR
jgi:DNA repair exonuclease SbcCD nuclease subunit